MADTLLLGLWIVSVAMAALSLGAFGALLLQRLLSKRRRALRERIFNDTVSALLTASEDHDLAVSQLAPLIKDPRTVAQAQLEFTSLIRGNDLELAVNALRDAGAERAFIAAISSGDRKFKRLAAEALGFFQSEQAVSALETVLASQAKTPVKVAATRSLLNLGQKPDLADILPRFDLRELEAPLEIGAIFQAFARDNPEPIIRRLRMGVDDESLRCMMIDALGRCDVYDGIPVLERAAAEPSARIRAAAIEALGNLQLPIAPAIIDAAISDQNSEVRAEAAEAIGTAVMPEYADRLETLLSDADWNVRFSAAGALLALGADYRSRLEAVAQNSESALAQRTASLVLSERPAA